MIRTMVYDRDSGKIKTQQSGHHVSQKNGCPDFFFLSRLRLISARLFSTAKRRDSGLIWSMADIDNDMGFLFTDETAEIYFDSR